MSNIIVRNEKPSDKKVASEALMQSPFLSGNSLLFQIFFLTQDQSQNVEVIETNEIDCGEIIQRLKMGELVFIKSIDLETLETPKSKLTRRKEEERKPFYFIRS